jgi:hypothetical protein
MSLSAAVKRRFTARATRRTVPASSIDIGEVQTLPSSLDLIKNETPKSALGDRGPERRFHRQIPDTETKPYPRNVAVPHGFERRSFVTL